MQLSRGSDDDALAVAADVGRALSRLFRAAGRAKALDAATGGDFHAVPVLLALRERGPLRSQDLAEALFADPSTISRQVSQLADRGYVERRPDPADRRASLLALTPLGSSVLDARMAMRERWLAAMISDWPARDRRRLAVLLDRFAAEFATRTSLPDTSLPDTSLPNTSLPAGADRASHRHTHSPERAEPA